MPLHRTEAIVLRSYRVGEADKVVVFLTRDQGKIRGLARGARRPRSRFGGSLEIGSEVELTYFEKESAELVSVDRCDIIRSAFSCSGDPLLACTLGYFAELTDAFAQEKEPNEKLYRLVRAALGALGEADPEKTTRYFEAWLLRLCGYYPRGEGCASCGRELVGRGALFRVEDREMRCPACASAGIALSRETLGYLREIWRRSPQELPSPASPAVLEELRQLHRKIVQHELDKELRSQSVLDELLRG
jgi:DNA repair protein RecO (recombination protein O)